MEEIKMTAQELQEFEAFRAEKKRREAEELRRLEREEYRRLVDEEIARAIPELKCVSNRLAETKAEVIEGFKTILSMKGELFGTRTEQRTHTFTSSDGTARLTLGSYVTDGYLDTVEDGIDIVREYIESLATDAKSRSLIQMVLRLLSRDSKGTLKASRIVQLRRVAEETGDERFLEGVRIIEEAYSPAVSRTFIRAEVRGKDGGWHNIPLGMTESGD